ncbi:hypothetical protein REC12_03520 [Desulfosporosinus sp. PR]|nr:hypothetical protein [Desulfosporosinus sp. PR]MDQ7092649.1 hypothetical protein [Desulfosporosinus sp. PR]
MKEILTTKAVVTVRPYFQAIEVEDFIFTTGHLLVNPDRRNRSG